MPYQFLALRRADGVEHVTLNRPEVRNAFDDRLIAELSAWSASLHARASSEGVRAVVLRGAGHAFSAGADLAWMSRMASSSEADNRRDADAVSRLFASLDTLPVPVIAVVHGAAFGGGCGLAAISDIVVADEAAVFGFTEVRLGIVPAVISPYVLAKIGQSAARELFLTGAPFTATRAREIGLVHAVVATDALERTVEGYLTALRAGGPEALAAAKALIASVAAAPTPDVAAHLTSEAIAARRASAEGREGLSAFLDKRSPTWTGGSRGRNS